jgi:hypothetical protein
MFCNFLMALSLKNDVTVGYQCSESAPGSDQYRTFLVLPDPHPDPLLRGTDPRIRIRIRIRTKMSRIPQHCQ